MNDTSSGECLVLLLLCWYQHVVFKDKATIVLLSLQTLEFDLESDIKKKYLAFQSFDFERHLMKVILNVPDEGYFERTWWRLFWTYLMKVILNVPDQGYSERTCWRLFQKRWCALHMISTFIFIYACLKWRILLA